MARIAPRTRCSSPQVTRYSTASWTLSQEVRNSSAVSFQESLRAQCPRKETAEEFLPGKFARPMPQEMHVNLGRGVFPHAPWHFFDQHPALLAVDPSHAIDQKNQVAPEADELKPSRRGRLVVAGRGLMTARTNCRGSFPRPHRDEDGLRVFSKAGSPVNKSRNGMALV